MRASLPMKVISWFVCNKFMKSRKIFWWDIQGKSSLLCQNSSSGPVMLHEFSYFYSHKSVVVVILLDVNCSWYDAMVN